MSTAWSSVVVGFALVACGKVVPAALDATAPQLVSIRVDPDLSTIRIGATAELTATATYDNAATEIVTSSVSWTASSLGGTATVVLGAVTGVTPGSVRITAELGGISGSSVVQVPPPVLIVTNFLTMNLKIFPIGANGDVAATQTIVGAATTFANPRGIAVLNDQIVVADQSANALNFFPIGSNGDVAPSRRIVGAATLLQTPTGLVIFNNEIYVANQNGTVLVFPFAAADDTPPIRTLTVGGTLQYAAIHAGELYVTNFGQSRVQVFPADATGMVTPVRVITGALVGLTNPTGIAISGSELFVTDTRVGTDEIRVFPVTANGDVAPLRVIAGVNTGLGYPDQLAIFNGELYVSNFDTNSVRVFPVGANGDVVPSRSIVGAATGFSGTVGTFVY